jgi:hypothetical protein
VVESFDGRLHGRWKLADVSSCPQASADCRIHRWCIEAGLAMQL